MKPKAYWNPGTDQRLAEPLSEVGKQVRDRFLVTRQMPSVSYTRFEVQCLKDPSHKQEMRGGDIRRINRDKSYPAPVCKACRALEKAAKQQKKAG